MHDRPIAPFLAALAAIMFVAAFSAAAVLRPDSSPAPTAAATAREAPAEAQENASLVTLVSPSLSRVAALPALHLPKARKPAKPKKPKPATTTTRTTPATPTTPRTTAPPVATAAPPVRRPVTPAPTKPKSNVGKTFDSEG